MRQRRGATPLAALAGVVSERTRRTPGALAAALARHWATLGASAGAIVLSGATGVSPASEEERAWLAGLGAATIHATGDLVGHTVEAQAPTGAVLATALLQRGAAEAVVTSVGHWRGDGAIRLTRAE